jgi:hypothetical protein
MRRRYTATPPPWFTYMVNTNALMAAQKSGMRVACITSRGVPTPVVGVEGHDARGSKFVATGGKE